MKVEVHFLEVWGDILAVAVKSLIPLANTGKLVSLHCKRKDNVGVPVRQIQDQVVDVEQVVAVPEPLLVEETLGVFPEERVPERAVERIVGVLVPQSLDGTVKVVEPDSSSSAFNNAMSKKWRVCPFRGHRNGSTRWPR